MAFSARLYCPLLIALGGCPKDEEDFTTFSSMLIEDERANFSLAMCGAENRPGFDLDAIKVTPATGGEFAFSHCEDSLGSACPNDHADVDAAIGVPDASPSSGFVSLNGGAIFCTFGKAVGPGDAIEVFESGQSTPEQYRVRLCDETGACGTGAAFSGSALIQVSDLMF